MEEKLASIIARFDLLVCGFNDSNGAIHYSVDLFEKGDGGSLLHGEHCNVFDVCVKNIFDWICRYKS